MQKLFVQIHDGHLDHASKHEITSKPPLVLDLRVLYRFVSRHLTQIFLTLISTSLVGEEVLLIAVSALMTHKSKFLTTESAILS